MLMIRNRPASTLVPAPFGHDVEKLFRAMLSPNFVNFGMPFGRPAVFPAINVNEDDAAVYVEAELPGFSESEIDVNVVGSEITIKGERSTEKEEKDANYHRRERWDGAFERTIHIPIEVESDKVSAELKNGVLTITLPKPEVARPRKIKVSVS